MYFYSWLVVVIILYIAIIDADGEVRTRRIVGGSSTSVMMFPHHVSLEKDGLYKCGGSIISANFVLTAGHCVAGQDIHHLVQYLKIRVGSTYAETNGNTHGVKDIILHEKYYMYPGIDFIVNDIALVKVDYPIIFNSIRQPIKLNGAGMHLVEGQKGNISGWGQSDRNLTLSLYLQYAEVMIISKKNCNDIYRNYIGEVAIGQFCAGRHGPQSVDACFGDSGGALVIEGRQAGIISWGLSCGEFPGIYVDVSYYREWIRSKTGV